VRLDGAILDVLFMDVLGFFKDFIESRNENNSIAFSVFSAM
jgi:hypothetical protein